MIFIFGGAYQGKKEYAIDSLGAETVFCCNETEIPAFNADVICDIEKFVLKCVRDGIEAAEYFKEKKKEWQDKILILTDISQGIVPMEAELRAMREMNGRLMLYLAGEAESVYRVFCGIGKKVK